MSEEDVVLQDLSDDDLIAVAMNAGLKPRKNATRDTLIRMIEESLAEGEAEAPENKAVAAKGKRYLLTINSDSDVGGNEPAKIGINGNVSSIPRDVECEVGEEIISALNDMVVTSYYQDGKDDEGRPIYKERHHKRFSFSYKPVE